MLMLQQLKSGKDNGYRRNGPTEKAVRKQEHSRGRSVVEENKRRTTNDQKRNVEQRQNYRSNRPEKEREVNDRRSDRFQRKQAPFCHFYNNGAFFCFHLTLKSWIFGHHNVTFFQSNCPCRHLHRWFYLASRDRCGCWGQWMLRQSWWWSSSKGHHIRRM